MTEFDAAMPSPQENPACSPFQELFDDALHGRAAQYAEWLDLVPVPSQT